MDVTKGAGWHKVLGGLLLAALAVVLPPPTSAAGEGVAPPAAGAGPRVVAPTGTVAPTPPRLALGPSPFAPPVRSAAPAAVALAAADGPAATAVLLPERGGAVALTDGSARVSLPAGGLPAVLRLTVSTAKARGLPPNFEPSGAAIRVAGAWVTTGASRDAEGPSARSTVPAEVGDPVAFLDRAAGWVFPSDSGGPRYSGPRYSEPRYWATVSLRLPPGFQTGQATAIARRTYGTTDWQLLRTAFDGGVATARTEQMGDFVLVTNLAISQQAPVAGEVIVDDDTNPDDLPFQYVRGVNGVMDPVPCSLAGCWEGDALWTFDRSDFHPLPLVRHDWATWTPALTAPGLYEVEAFIPSWAGTVCRVGSLVPKTVGATYHVIANGQDKTAQVNQREINGAWVSLGAYNLAGDGSDKVELDDMVPETEQCGSVVLFDALRFTGCSDVPPPEITDVWWRQDGGGHLLVVATFKGTRGLAQAWVDLTINGQTVEVPMKHYQGSEYYAITPDPGRTGNGVTPQVRVRAINGCGATTCWPTSCSAVETERMRYRMWAGLKGNVAMAGEPVNTATGAFIHAHTDISAPGPGLPFEFARTYNSVSAATDGPLGIGWTHSYSMSVKLFDDPMLHGARVTFGDGRIAYFEEGDDGKYKSPPGDHGTLDLEGPGHVLVQPDQVRYHFGADGRIAFVDDRHGNRITLTYEGPELRRIVDTAGRAYDLQYSGGRLIRVTDALGRPHAYAYNAAGDLVSYTNPAGGITLYAYDAEHWMTSITDATGDVFVTNEYDDRGRVVRQQDAKGNTAAFRYPDNQHTEYTDFENHTTKYVYDADLRLESVTDARDSTARFEYDAADNLVRLMDREGNETRFEYDGAGNLTKRIDALDGTSSYAYDADKDLTFVQDEAGATATLTYDERGSLVSHMDNCECVTQFDHDARGLLVKRKDCLGRETTYDYDAAGNLTTVTDPTGAIARFESDAMGRLLSMTDAEGRTVRFGLSPTDQVLAVTDSMAKVTTFEYDIDDRLVLARDRRGFATRFIYDRNDAVTRVIDALGGVVQYQYDRMSNVATFTDANGNTTRYRYDPTYNVDLITDARGGMTKFRHDGNGDLLGVTDAVDATTELQRDGLRRVVTHVDAAGGSTSFAYDPVGRLTVTTDAVGATTRVAYACGAQPESVTDALNGTTRYKYDGVGNLIKRTDADGYDTDYAYDSADRLVQITDALRHETTYAYDRVGNLIQVVDPRKGITTLGYDPNDWLTEVVDAVNGHRYFTYDEEGNRRSATDENGHTTRFVYDKLGRMTQRTLPGGQRTDYTYDANGNILAVTLPTGAIDRFAYDELDRLIQERNPLGFSTLYAYDAVGNLKARTDAENNATKYDYDKLGQLIRVTDALNGVTAYKYDAVGSLTEIMDARGNKVSRKYDPLRRLAEETNPLGAVWSFGYDRRGNLTYRKDAKGAETRWTYNGNGWLSETKHGASLDAKFDYDENGNLTSFVDVSGTSAFKYDPLDRLVETTRSSGILANNTVGYDYDPAGNLRMTMLPSGVPMRYQYNQNGWLTSTTDPQEGETTYKYRLDGLLEREDKPNGNWTTYTYDKAGRRTGVVNGRTRQSRTALISSFSYTLDRVGNPTKMIRAKYGTNNAKITGTYAYDKLYRLIKAYEKTSPSTSRPLNAEYTYDAVGNRLSKKTNAPTEVNGAPSARDVLTNYVYSGADQMLTAGTDRFTYDANGNRASAKSKSWSADYEYDAENNLKLARVNSTLSGGSKVVTVSFVYDALGRRVERDQTGTGQSGTTQYLYRGMGFDTVAEYAKPGYSNPVLDYRDAFGSMGRNQEGPGGGWFAYAGDGRGNVTSWSDAAGIRVQEYRYGAYGEMLAKGDKDKTNNSTGIHLSTTFSGKRWDPVLGTYDFGARDYDPVNGVWLTPDIARGRLAEPKSLHRYAYARNNPLAVRDAYGYSWSSELQSRLTGALATVGDRTSRAWSVGITGLGNAFDTGVNLASTLIHGVSGGGWSPRSAGGAAGGVAGGVLSGVGETQYRHCGGEVLGMTVTGAPQLLTGNQRQVDWIVDVASVVKASYDYVTDAARTANLVNTLSQIDRRFRIGSALNPRWFKLVPTALQREVVLTARGLTDMVPEPLWSKVSGLSSRIGEFDDKFGPMVTFVVAPFTELPTSINVITERIATDPNAANPLRLGAYGLAGALDAASFGIVRSEIKGLTLGWQPASDWADRNINAGAVTDRLFEGLVKSWDWWEVQRRKQQLGVQ